MIIDSTTTRVDSMAIFNDLTLLLADEEIDELLFGSGVVGKAQADEILFLDDRRGIAQAGEVVRCFII